MMRFLAEDTRYQVYALAENVYLKRKRKGALMGEFDPNDVWVTHHYGDPTGALLLDDYLIVAGCGLSIFHIGSGVETRLFDAPNASRWTAGLHQDESDAHLEFRYVSYADGNSPWLYKMNVLTKEATVLA